MIIKIFPNFIFNFILQLKKISHLNKWLFYNVKLEFLKIAGEGGEASELNITVKG